MGRINRRVEIPLPSTCYRCGSPALYKHGRMHKIVYDLRFFDFGVKRWVTQYSTGRVRCRCCSVAFPPPEFTQIRGKFGHDLRIWVIYQMIALRQTHHKVFEHLGTMFHYDFNVQFCQKNKAQMADFYSGTYASILEKIAGGRFVHVDETSVSIQGTAAYVWVFTNLEEVAYVYHPTREGDLLRSVLRVFNGILISDFYSAYDSVDCLQQKCLIHLMRDMNDDLRKHPFDEEYGRLIKDFSKLLKDIIVTVDRYGLRKRHLNKHRKHVERFFAKHLTGRYRSEVARSYQKRLTKFQDKLFTFLTVDGVPWNNNYAEHAIKAFATYRNITNGCFTENGIRQYLVLLSIYQTCVYKEIDFLRFLRSRETTFESFSARS